MSYSRREFIRRGVTLVTAGVTVPMFLDNTAWVLADPMDLKNTQQASGKDDTILVVVQLSGGNDGLNMVVPYGDDQYHRARPAIRKTADNVLAIDKYVGLNGNMPALKGMYDDGRLSVIQGVGYPNPDRSHFRSMDIWHSAAPEIESPHSGWLGRYFDNTCHGSDPSGMMPGISIGDSAPMAMVGEKVLPVSFENPDQFRYQGSDQKRHEKLNDACEEMQAVKAVETEFDKRLARLKGDAPPAEMTTDNQLAFLTRTAMDARVNSATIREMTEKHKAPTAYPRGSFGSGLQSIAAMIAGGLPTRVYYVSLGGFDTHANQANNHDRLMTELNDGLAAFLADLKQQENDHRVLTMTFSEFGRRVSQNASSGTDHGAASCMFLMGPQVKSGLIGKHPSLTDLERGDLKYGVDFRNVYATVLQDWLRTDVKSILGQAFKPLPVLAKR